VIYINIDDIELPDGWEQRASKALEEVASMPSHLRSDAIAKKSAIWSELKSSLMKLSNGKCWYCETRQIRSDNNVDHFRPKNQVSECASHSGYWWLAFDFRNYRFACTFCNSRRIDEENETEGGKQTHFPLLNEPQRARCEDDDIEIEEPCLLDPICPSDPGLLWFDETGFPQSRYSKKRAPIQYFRADTSIRLYHLDHRNLVLQRKRLHRIIKRKVRLGSGYFERLLAGDGDAKCELDEVIDELISLAKRESEHSSAARAYIMGFRGTQNEWLDIVITSM